MRYDKPPPLVFPPAQTPSTAFLGLYHSILLILWNVQDDVHLTFVSAYIPTNTICTIYTMILLLSPILVFTLKTLIKTKSNSDWLIESLLKNELYPFRSHHDKYQSSFGRSRLILIIHWRNPHDSSRHQSVSHPTPSSSWKINYRIVNFEKWINKCF